MSEELEIHGTSRRAVRSLLVPCSRSKACNARSAGGMRTSSLLFALCRTPNRLLLVQE